MCQRLACWSLLQACLPAKFQDVKFQVRAWNRHEAFILYFSNYFVICLQSIFSVVEIILELFVVCQNSCLYINFVLSAHAREGYSSHPRLFVCLSVCQCRISKLAAF